MGVSGSLASRESSICKGTLASINLAALRSSKEASAAGAGEPEGCSPTRQALF